MFAESRHGGLLRRAEARIADGGQGGLDEQESAVAQKVATCDEYGGNKSFAKRRHSYEVA